jgi:excisionase family DNA binding protein
VIDVVGDMLELVIHWQGGDHTRLSIRKNRPGQSRWATEIETVDLVRALARQMPDYTIAALLNRSGKPTGRGNNWTRGRVCSLRHQYDIDIYREGERADRGEVTLEETAAALSLSTSTIRRLIAEGALPATQFCKGAPWIIRQMDLERPELQRKADARRSRRPPPDDRQQNLLELSKE